MVDLPHKGSERYSIAEEYDYNKEPFISLLHKCLSFLSTQDLSVLADDIQNYVLSPDQDPQKGALLKDYPCTWFVLQVFRESFRSFIKNHEGNGLISGGNLSMNQQTWCVDRVAQEYTDRMCQRINCYTARLNVELITALSTIEYESKSPQKERIAILPSISWMKKDGAIEFDSLERVVLEHSNLRALRKQLRTCGDGALAVWKDENDRVYKTVGIISGEIVKNLPYFEFKKRAEWYFIVPDLEGIDGRRVRYTKGIFTLPILNLEKAYETKLAALNIKETQRRRIRCILGGIQECEHGAILIIGQAKMIKTQASRLGSNKRGVLLKPKVSLIQKDEQLNKSVLKQFASVNGAIFLDYNGNCYAFGVILDGVAKYPGNNSRGSRYNSTKTFLEWIRKKRNYKSAVLGVVKSEDGMVDLFY